MKIEEIRDMATDEIDKEIEKAREKLFRSRFQAKGKDIDNPGELKRLRKQIARMKTVQRERQLASERSTDSAEGAA